MDTSRYYWYSFGKQPSNINIFSQSVVVPFYSRLVPSYFSSHHEEMSATMEIKTNSPRLYLVICNIQSLANVKSLMNTAVAFGCLQVWIVGQSKNLQNSKWITKQFQDALDQHHIELLFFPKWNDCLRHIQTSSPRISLVGVEIDANSQVLDDMDATPPFVSEYNDIAILMGNEGQGIHSRHLEACQGRLIRIPQYGVGTASFNVNVACSIVLYHLHQWKYKRNLLITPPKSTNESLKNKL